MTTIEPNEGQEHRVAENSSFELGGHDMLRCYGMNEAARTARTVRLRAPLKSVEELARAAAIPGLAKRTWMSRFATSATAQEHEVICGKAQGNGPHSIRIFQADGIGLESRLALFAFTAHDLTYSHLGQGSRRFPAFGFDLGHSSQPL